ncbi:hypothetical protein Dimus_029257, partial [Dionaea muscipula]
KPKKHKIKLNKPVRDQIRAGITEPSVWSSKAERQPLHHAHHPRQEERVNHQMAAATWKLETRKDVNGMEAEKQTNSVRRATCHAEHRRQRASRRGGSNLERVCHGKMATSLVVGKSRAGHDDHHRSLQDNSTDDIHRDSRSPHRFQSRPS